MVQFPRGNTALVNNASAVESAPPLAATQIIAPLGIALNALVNTAAHGWRDALSKASASGGNSVCCDDVTLDDSSRALVATKTKRAQCATSQRSALINLRSRQRARKLYSTHVATYVTFMLTPPRAAIFVCQRYMPLNPMISACQRLRLANARFLFWALAAWTQDAPDFSPHDWRQFPRPNHRRD